MPPVRAKSPAVDEYIARQTRQSRSRLAHVRMLIRRTVPAVEEKISYRMPAWTLDGRILVWVGAFKTHIGLYPPVKADARLARALRRYAGPKGNLRFPLDEPMPYPLVTRFVKARRQQLTDESSRGYSTRRATTK